MNPFTVLYTMPTCACFLSLSVTYWRKELRICYNKLLYPTTLNAIIINNGIHYNPAPFILMIITAIITASIDIYHHYTRFSVFNWICFYWSGIAVSNNMIHIANAISAATHNYELLNRYLDKYTHKNLTPSQKFKMGEKFEVPRRLLQWFPGSNCTILHKIFIIHDDTSRVVRLINKIAGKQVCTVDLLSFHKSCLSWDIVDFYYSNLECFQISVFMGSIFYFRFSSFDVLYYNFSHYINFYLQYRNGHQNSK